MHKVDPLGKPEKELAIKYTRQAEALENAGYVRLATTLGDVVKDYEHNAEMIIARHGKD